ncbi:hypothetical protein [Psychrobacter sp. DAB_AL43B]|uniref:hypothetical protein n=1 Tax=Psychrobacter sp. DAB_AL43B TaxID=1028416 RepID=UPI0009A71F0E|nr:hypothetical protein [Psychrobacter sp. DAB_AL43B]SLJ84888.1 hypothetical protein DABAL43B_1693 [Psychrobacter sp. DAB_AL43B]
MNKLMGVFLLGAALSLTACGGDSDSSGSYTGSNTTPPTQTDITTKKPCNVSGTTITGLVKDSCRFEDKNADANMVIGCNGNTMTLDGKIGGFSSSNSTYLKGTNIGKFVLKCP